MFDEWNVFSLFIPFANNNSENVNFEKRTKTSTSESHSHICEIKLYAFLCVLASVTRSSASLVKGFKANDPD